MAVTTELVATPLQQMAATTPTDYWNDSSSVEELEYALPKAPEELLNPAKWNLFEEKMGAYAS